MTFSHSQVCPLRGHPSHDFSVFQVSLFYLQLDHNHPHRLIRIQEAYTPSSHLTQEQSRSGMQSGFISWAHQVSLNVQLMWCVEKGLKWHMSPLEEDIMISDGFCCISTDGGEWGAYYTVFPTLI